MRYSMDCIIKYGDGIWWRECPRYDTRANTNAQDYEVLTTDVRQLAELVTYHLSSCLFVRLGQRIPHGKPQYLILVSFPTLR
jgi:hypothetical protein